MRTRILRGLDGSVPEGLKHVKSAERFLREGKFNEADAAIRAAESEFRLSYKVPHEAWAKLSAIRDARKQAQFCVFSKAPTHKRSRSAGWRSPFKIDPATPLPTDKESAQDECINNILRRIKEDAENPERPAVLPPVSPETRKEYERVRKEWLRVRGTKIDT